MQRDTSYRTTPQAPIHSGFGPHTTARDVPRGHDLMGKTALVTGGYSGIGLATTRALVEAGATAIVPARPPDKARASMGGMPRVELEEMDLLDPASVDACSGSPRPVRTSAEPSNNSAGRHMCGLRPPLLLRRVTTCYRSQKWSRWCR
jgi:short chain dehydrogenase